MTAILLAHSPLTGPAAWGELPGVLRYRGHPVVVVDVHDDDDPPFATRYVARAATQLAAADVTEPVVLVGHSGAGYLIPQLGAARRAARRGVAGYVFLDAGIPHGRGATRLSLARAEETEFADELERLLDAGGRFPPWTEEDLRELVPDTDRRHALVASLRPRSREFFVEQLPVPADWPDAPCAMVALSPSYASTARMARARHWPVLEPKTAGGHFAMCTDPVAVADALEDVLAQL